MGKWQNTRDTFMRTLRTGKNGKTPKRKYMYYEHIKFLTKVAPESCTIDYLDDDSVDSEPKKPRRKRRNTDESETYNDDDSKPFGYYIETVDKKSNIFDNSSDNEVYVSHKKKLKKEHSSNVLEIESSNNDLNYVEVDETNNPRLMNEDEAFFASLLPSVVKYNEDERLQFRIQVLNVMNRIREKQRTTN